MGDFGADQYPLIVLALFLYFSTNHTQEFCHDACRNPVLDVLLHSCKSNTGVTLQRQAEPPSEMSHLSDISSWALREQENSGSQLSQEELRAQRLARMSNPHQNREEVYDAMDVDRDSHQVKVPSESIVESQAGPQLSNGAPLMAGCVSESNKKHQKMKSDTDVTARKAQRKKEHLIKKILNIIFKCSTTIKDTSSAVEIDLGGDEPTITVQSITEILMVRLSMEISQQPVISYLGSCHRRATEELRSLRQQKRGASAESEEILSEIKNQVVSFAASCILEPDMPFPMADEAHVQIAQCLLDEDPSSSIIFGVEGNASSFYYCLCEEILQQNSTAFSDLIGRVTDVIVFERLSTCKSVLETTGSGSAVAMVSALRSMCAHKTAASSISLHKSFLLPGTSSREAKEVVRPPVSGSLFQMISSGEQPPLPYQRRSGQGLERQTVLGQVLRLGVPRNNPAFERSAVLRQSLDSVTRTNRTQRQQLLAYQDAFNQLILSFIKAGEEPRNQVMQWLVDALLVNAGASALQPDPSKISSSNLLMNLSAALLKLCSPFVDNKSKHHLIDLGFVSSPQAHKGVFATTGDDAVPRLSEGVLDSKISPYEPKNKFIPQCFFLCARSLHFGIGPLLRHHENLLRHISHAHYELTSNNRDPSSDPNFAALLSRQRSNEIYLFQEENAIDTLRFCNLICAVVENIDSDEVLRTVPEDFISDVCHIVMTIAKLKSKLLEGVGLNNVLKMVVKLLSSDRAALVRNYNLRAKLGDVLYEIFLPASSTDRRDVPLSVSIDPVTGQSYLLSDKLAQGSLAPSLLLLYGEVEHTGYYDKMSHRAKIASLIHYLWESSEHRPAFRRITQNQESFILFANGIINETNTLIATIMQKLPEIREAQMKMKNPAEWGQLSEEQREQLTSRLSDNEREVKYSLSLCNKVLQMFSYLNTDNEIRSLFLVEELCSRLVSMLLHVLTKLVGSKGLELKVENPEQYDFRPKEMLRDLCAVFALFASSTTFQSECARAGCQPSLLDSAVKTCVRLNLLTGESIDSLRSLPSLVGAALERVKEEEALTANAPEEFLDELLSTFMKDPVDLPSGHTVDRSTIMQHLLNDNTDPFSRNPMTMNDVKRNEQLKAKMEAWLEEKRAQS